MKTRREIYCEGGRKEEGNRGEGGLEEERGEDESKFAFLSGKIYFKGKFHQNFIMFSFLFLFFFFISSSFFSLKWLRRGAATSIKRKKKKNKRRGGWHEQRLFEFLLWFNITTVGDDVEKIMHVWSKKEKKKRNHSYLQHTHTHTHWIHQLVWWVATGWMFDRLTSSSSSFTSFSLSSLLALTSPPAVSAPNPPQNVTL